MTLARDDAGCVRVHQHTGYVQSVPSLGEFFAVCMQCGMLPAPNFPDVEQAQAVVDAHCRNSGEVVRGF